MENFVGTYLSWLEENNLKPYDLKGIRTLLNEGSNTPKWGLKIKTSSGNEYIRYDGDYSFDSYRDAVDYINEHNLNAVPINKDSESERKRFADEYNANLGEYSFLGMHNTSDRTPEQMGLGKITPNSPRKGYAS